jgi:hypothetical protein
MDAPLPRPSRKALCAGRLHKILAIRKRPSNEVVAHIACWRAPARREATMSIVAATVQAQLTLQVCLFAAMVVHMFCDLAAPAAAPEAPHERDDIPLWPYAA